MTTETTAIIQELGALSYLGIFGVSFLANVVVPIPEEAVLVIFGYLAHGNHLNPLILVPLIMIGLLTSDIIIYTLARRGSKVVTLFYKKVFASKLDSRMAWIETHMNKVIFFSRFLMQLRFLGPFLAGQRGVPFKRFFLYDFLAILVYVPLFVWIGWYFRTRIDLILNGVNAVKHVVLIILILLVSLSILKVIKRKIFGRKVDK